MDNNNSNNGQNASNNTTISKATIMLIMMHAVLAMGKAAGFSRRTEKAGADDSPRGRGECGLFGV